VPPKDWAQFDGRAYIHNSQLWILVKTGFLGYLPFAAFIVLGFFRGLKYWRTVPDERLRAIVLGFTLGLLAMLIGSTVEPTLIESEWTPVIALMLGANELILRGAMAKGPVPGVTGSSPPPYRDAADV
jgi:O-antigen ligase